MEGRTYGQRNGIVITRNSQVVRDDAERTNDASYLKSPDTDVGVFEYAGPRGYANEIVAGGGTGIAAGSAGSVDGGAGSVNGGAGSVNGGAGSADAESAESDAGSAGSDASKQSNMVVVRGPREDEM